MTERERLLDLLAAQATEGLSDEDTHALERALCEHPDVDADELALAAAAVDLAFSAGAVVSESMPDDVKQRVLARAPDHVPAPATGATVNSIPQRRQASRGPLDRRWLGWYAAAAMLALALWAPWSAKTEQPVPPPSAPTLAEQRDDLIDGAPDAIVVDWAAPEIDGYTQVRGDVVWSNARQAGFMRLVDLPVNRASVEQYQLWIVDPRDKHPIDGGVFDIPAGASEVIVPIDAKLPVTAPQAFAITLEQVGGVVVSDGPLLVVAPVRT